MKRLRLLEYAKLGAALAVTVGIMIWLSSSHAHVAVVVVVGVVVFVALMFVFNPETEAERQHRIKRAQIGDILAQASKGANEIYGVAGSTDQTRVKFMLFTAAEQLHLGIQALQQSKDADVYAVKELVGIVDQVCNLAHRYHELANDNDGGVHDKTMKTFEDDYLPKLLTAVDNYVRSVRSGRAIRFEVDMEMMSDWMEEHG